MEYIMIAAFVVGGVLWVSGENQRLERITKSQEEDINKYRDFISLFVSRQHLAGILLIRAIEKPKTYETYLSLAKFAGFEVGKEQEEYFRRFSKKDTE